MVFAIIAGDSGTGLALTGRAERGGDGKWEFRHDH
jgi:hypothetical protein